jgi:hypothetical protein
MRSSVASSGHASSGHDSSDADTTMLLNPAASLHAPTTTRRSRKNKGAEEGEEGPPSSSTRVTAALCYALSSVAIQVRTSIRT